MSEYFVNEGNKIGYMPTEFGATGNDIIEKKLVAGADITKGQVVILSDSLTVIPSSAASAHVLGVAAISAKSGEPITIECEGLFKLVAASAITAPALVESAASGKVATVGGTPVKTIGLALNDASTDGAVFVKFSI